MGCLLLCSIKGCLSIDIMSGNPNKKIKLEIQNRSDKDAANDDLWGPDDDITAEEFDMLEIQATQSCNQNGSSLTNALQENKLAVKSTNSVEVHDLKQLQYELEGRVKLLSLSLEKSAKELNEERLCREQLINERIKHFQEQELNLRKEIEKMQSILEFKEQEMKSTHSNMQVLKSQLLNKKGIAAEIPGNSNFEDFLKSSKHEQLVSHQNKVHEKYRKYKLSSDMPKGEMKGIEILSSILSTRLTVPSFLNRETMMNCACSTDSSFNSGLAPVSIVYLKNEQKCSEILEYYSNFLKNHVNLLKALASKNNQVNSNNSSPVSTKPKEAFCSHTVIYLSDITYIYSSTSFKSHHQIGNIDMEDPSKSMHIQKSERESSSSSFEQNARTSVSDNTMLILQSLSALSNSETYPNGYHKNEEMEFALSALLSICSSCPKEFLEFIGELPCYFFSNPHQSVTGLCTSIKLLTTLSTNKRFTSYLMHRDSNCVFCLMGGLLHDAIPVDPKKFSVSFTLIQHFLSSVFSIHNYKETQLEASSCISKVVQGLIKSLWKYFQLRQENNSYFEILKKGLLLLLFISSCIPNFKEKRNPVEDEYVSLISGLLAISKENCELKEFSDLIHNVWDFQADISEFDLDDLSEEAHACTNDIDNE